MRGNAFRAGAQPPDQAAGENQTDCDQLRAGHDSAENRAATGIIAEEFEKVASDAVKKQVSAEDLAVEFLPFQHPHEDEEIRQFDGGLEKLGWFERNSKRGSNPGLRQRIFEYHSPEVRSRFAVAATGGEASDAANGVAQSESRGECVASGQSRHAVLVDIPGRGGKSGNEPAGEYPSRLQGRKTENFMRMGGVVAPVIDDVKDLCANDSAKHDQNAEIPGVFWIDALLFGIADADPKAD